MEPNEEGSPDRWLQDNRDRYFEWRQRKVEAFVAYVQQQLHVQLAVRQLRSVDELIALGKRHRVPLDHVDVVCFYRQWDEPFWPWHGQPMAVRRHFAHLGVMPGDDQQLENGPI